MHVSLSSMVYLYDDRDRLTQVTKDGIDVSYRYNGDGLLVERSENGVNTRYYYDGANIIAEGVVTDGTVSYKASYIRGNALVARVDANGSKAYYIHNGHGDVVGLTDRSGNMLNEYTYDLWGNALTVHETVPNPFRYSGELWDESAELQYLRARWYDPSVGRFINEDSYEGDLSNPLSLNLYTYTANNPLKYHDPTGHFFDIIADIGFALYDTYVLIKDPSWENAGYLALDIGAAIVPFATGAGPLARTAAHADEIVDGLKYSDDAAVIVKSCNCFTAGTKVLTDEGEKNIEDIEVGDRVLSKDEVTGEVAYKEVTATFNHETDEIYQIHVGDQTIESTFNHPFWVEGKGWTFVKDLKVGDLLVQSSGNTLEIDSIELEYKQVTVYNMTVDEFHTYFVSDLGIWVHNSNCTFNIAKGRSNAIDVTSSANQHLSGQVLNNANSLVSLSKDVVFATKSQALEFINKKYGNLTQDVAQSRSANGWHFDNHTIAGYGDQALDHINLYTGDIRTHIFWRSE